ncbi:N-acetylmuramoyl-L-alanine amidase AmiA precursor [Bacteroidales bacterium Barb6]|nr:N-acetylmuramoyl-L-alanine amidase AmiA precursor [Bacteroidales bacterium Barb6]
MLEHTVFLFCRVSVNRKTLLLLRFYKKMRNFFLYICLFLLAPVGAGGKEFTLVIDPGHGGKDPGALGSIAKEKNINLAVALKVGELIAERHGDVRVIYTRRNDHFVDLDERAGIANRNKADLFISIHANALSRKDIKGTETYTLGLARTDENLQVAMRENAAILLENDYMQKYEGFNPHSTESYIIFEFMQNRHVEQSISFASQVQKEFIAARRINRGVRQAGFLVLRKTSMPSALVELGYISNAEEEHYMTSAAGQTQLSKALCEAFTRFKREYDHKQGTATITAPTTAPAQPATRKEVYPTTDGRTVYKVQILASGRKLPAKARMLKGYSHTRYYVENGMYKYTYGETTDIMEIKAIRKKVSRDFKDAFIIAITDGEKTIVR